MSYNTRIRGECMVNHIIDSGTNTFILFDATTGEVLSQDEITKPKQHRSYSKASFKDRIHQPMLTLFSYTMTKNEYQMFYKLLGYFTLQGELTMKLTEIAKLEDMRVKSLRNMVSKYRLRDTKNMMYLITNQYPKVYH